MQIDRLFDWKSTADAPIQPTLAKQKEHVRREFEERLAQSILNLNEQGLNVALYWKNPDKRKYVNVVPTSAITGEGIPDMLQLLVDLTQVSSNQGSYLISLWCRTLDFACAESRISWTVYLLVIAYACRCICGAVQVCMHVRAIGPRVDGSGATLNPTACFGPDICSVKCSFVTATQPGYRAVPCRSIAWVCIDLEHAPFLQL